MYILALGDPFLASRFCKGNFSHEFICSLNIHEQPLAEPKWLVEKEIEGKEREEESIYQFYYT